MAMAMAAIDSSSRDWSIDFAVRACHVCYEVVEAWDSVTGLGTQASTKFVSVPYSEFFNKINTNQVQKVEVDGVNVMFRLKNEGGSVGGESEMGAAVGGFQDSESVLRSVSPTRRIIYTTTRPSDIKTPYEKMIENHVEFGSPDKRSGGF